LNQWTPETGSNGIMCGGRMIPHPACNKTDLLARVAFPCPAAKAITDELDKRITPETVIFQALA